MLQEMLPAVHPALSTRVFGSGPCSHRVWAVTARVSIYSDGGERHQSVAAAVEQRALWSSVVCGAGHQPSDCWELLLLAYLNVPFQRVLSVETAIFSLIVNLEVTHRLLTHSLLL